MAETYEAYVARIRSYVKGRDPRRILRSTPSALRKRLAGVPSRKLKAPPAAGKWSVGQILAHLSELEMLWGYRMRTILEHDGCEIVGMDQDEWAKNSKYERIDPRRALDTFRAIRNANVDLLDRLPPSALRRRGVHSQFGPLSMAGIVTLMAGHDVNHSRQIDAILKGRRAGPSSSRR